MRSKIAALLFAVTFVAVGLVFPYLMTQPANGAEEMLCQGSDFSSPMVACNANGAMVVAATGTFTVVTGLPGGTFNQMVSVGQFSSTTVTLGATASQIILVHDGSVTSRTCVHIEQLNAPCVWLSATGTTSFGISDANIKTFYMRNDTATSGVTFIWTFAQ